MGLSRDDLIKILEEQAQCGSVRAVELLLREVDSKPEAKPKTIVDELASRRRQVS